MNCINYLFYAKIDKEENRLNKDILNIEIINNDKEKDIEPVIKNDKIIDLSLRDLPFAMTDRQTATTISHTYLQGLQSKSCNDEIFVFFTLPQSQKYLCFEKWHLCL